MSRAASVHLDLADTLVIKEENLFLISPRHGALPARDAHQLGLYYRDCRHLSGLEWRVDGQAPRRLGASDAGGTRAVYDLSVPGMELSLRLERSLEAPTVMRERLALTSHHPDHLTLDLQLRLAADFAPMLAIRGLVALDARPALPEREGDELVVSALGRDGVERFTRVRIEAPSWRGDGGELHFEVDLPAGGRQELGLVFSVSESSNGTPPRSEVRRASASAAPPARVTSDDDLFDRILARSRRDLDVLRSEIDGHSYFCAGLPWFATLFGRDSLISAVETLPLAREQAESTLRLLGSLLGRAVDDEREEQPGKVLHELRVGEPANLGETPFARYYATADATPLWLCLLADHADWAGNLDLFRELRPQVDAALGWIEHHGDLDGDALIEYRLGGDRGLANHGWKDSWNGVPDAEGRPLAPPVALVEVQGYAVRALRRVGGLLELDGDPRRARELRARAADVEAALERLWLEDRGRYAIGLDGVKRPGSSLSSNPGHLLWAGAVSPARAARVRDTLMSDAMFSGWGIRTLGEGQPGFNPMGYHTGSVWPHDNALIAHGLRRYGFDQDFARVFEALLEAASRFGGYRLPELFAGHPRTADESPVPYPVACAPQAWAAGAIPYLLACGLGLSADGLNGRLRIIRPGLPRWLDRLEIAGLRVAGASVDLRFERTGGQVTLADARVTGQLEVVTEEG